MPVANRAHERWFGVTPESLIGKHISELLGPLHALNLPYIEGALRGDAQEFERESRIRRAVRRDTAWRATSPTRSTASCAASS